MKIVKMTQSKHVSDRWYADLEDGSKIQVNLNMIAEYSLFTGRDLTEAEVKNIRNNAEKTGVKARALRMLGARSMSGKEMFDKLCEKGIEEQIAAETVAWLENLGYINDREYAMMIVKHYAEKGYGRRRIIEELYRRGIEQNLRDEAMESMPETNNAIDALVEKKLRGKVPDKKELKKLTDMLARRGFSWSEISGALRRYEFEAEEE